MTIILSPEMERALTEEAARLGTTPEQAAERILGSGLAVPVGHMGPRGEELRAQVNAARETSALENVSPAEAEKEKRSQEAWALIRSGYFKERLSSSEEFSARKEEEKALEERRWYK